MDIRTGQRILYTHLRTFEWFDKHLCDALLRSPLAAAASTVDQTTKYYNEQNRLWFRRSYAHVSMQALAPLSCLIVVPAACRRQLSVGDLHGLEPYMHTVEGGRDVHGPLQSQARKTTLHLPVLNGRDPANVRVEIAFLFSCFRSECLGDLPHSDHLSMADTSRIRGASCIFHFVDYNACADKQNIIITLRKIVRDMLVNQILVVVITVNANESWAYAERDLTRLYVELGGSEDYPSAAASKSWRLWCLYEGTSNYQNWVEIFRWACLAAIWKRNEYYQGGGHG